MIQPPVKSSQSRRQVEWEALDNLDIRLRSSYSRDRRLFAELVQVASELLRIAKESLR